MKRGSDVTLLYTAAVCELLGSFSAREPLDGMSFVPLFLYVPWWESREKNVVRGQQWRIHIHEITGSVPENGEMQTAN